MILDQIVSETRREVERRKSVLSMDRLRAELERAPAPRGFNRALRARRGGTDVSAVACIAEIKRRSPSAGWIRQEADAADIARRYQSAGARAISVLTDEPFFGGTLADLRAVRAAVDVPVLRKDFILDPYQLVEARAAGADATLLIVAALDDQTLRTLLDEAARLDLDILVEAHNEDEVRRAIALRVPLLGINHRDLRTFSVDTTLAVRMRPLIPAETTVVAESGLKSADDVQRMHAAGVDAILVGESLMKAPDPGAALRTLYGLTDGTTRPPETSNP